MNSTAEVAPPIEQGYEKQDPSLVWTLCNNPSISIPAFSGPNNLPFGLQVVAPHFSDFALLSFCDKLIDYDLVPKVAPIPKIAV